MRRATQCSACIRIANGIEQQTCFAIFEWLNISAGHWHAFTYNQTKTLGRFDNRSSIQINSTQHNKQQMTAGGNDQHKTTHSNDEGELVLGEEGMERIDERFVSHDIKTLGVVVSAVDTRSKRCNESELKVSGKNKRPMIDRQNAIRHSRTEFSLTSRNSSQS